MMSEDDVRVALAHAVALFEALTKDSAEDESLCDDLGDAHRQEAQTLAVLRELLRRHGVAC